MSSHRPAPSRRALLGTAAGAGVAGVLGAWAAPASAVTPDLTLPAVLTTPVAVPTGGAKGRRAVGDGLAHRVAVHGADGAEVGELVVTGAVLAVRGPADATAAVHHHLLRLAGGTLAGHGAVDLGGRGEFVVVGGTGAFRGATGAYRLTPGPGAGSTLTWEA